MLSGYGFLQKWKLVVLFLFKKWLSSEKQGNGDAFFCNGGSQ